MAGKSQLQQACDMSIEVFHRYSHGENLLGKAEFKKMVEEEFPGCRENAGDAAGVAKLFEELDKDKEQKMDFVECSCFMARFLLCANDQLRAKEKGRHPPHGREDPQPAHH